MGGGSGTAGPVFVSQFDDRRMTLDIADEILMLNPNATPLIVLLSKLRKQQTISPEFIWFEDDLGPYIDRINHGGGYIAGAVELVVDNGVYFAPHDLVKVFRSSEVIRVIGVNVDTNTLTVTRGYGTTVAAAINDDDYLCILGNAMPENSTHPDYRSGQPTKRTAYTQILRTPFGVSRNSATARMVTGEDERKRLTRLKGEEHNLKQEQAFWFGEGKNDLVNHVRAIKGIFAYITTNVYDATGALTESEFEQFLETAFAYGSSDKFFFAATRIISVINGFAKAKLEIEMGEDTYGLSIIKYRTPRGTLHMMEHKGFIHDYNDTGVVLDLDEVTLRPYVGADTHLNRNIQEPSRDGFLDEYFTEVGLQLNCEKKHAVIVGVTS